MAVRAGVWTGAWPVGASGSDRARGVEIAEPIDWAAAYVEYLPRVYDYFRLRTGENALAEDLSSQTFELAWRGRAGFRGDRGTLPAWLFAIARNVAASHYRRLPASPDLPLDRAIAHPDPHEDNSPEGAAQRHTELGIVRDLLMALPPRERELIELKYGGGLTNRAIARLTGLSESNVGTLVHRTVHRLRIARDARGGEEGCQR